MYCPNCGKTNSAEQRFCRSCGLQLEKVAQAVAEQLAQSGDTKRLPSGSQFEPAPSVTEHTTELLTVTKKGGAE